MATTITRLPLEVLQLIFKYLNPFDLECVAKTFNRVLYSASSPLLEPHKDWISNARHMTRLFQTQELKHRTKRLLPAFPGHIRPLETDDALEELARRDYKACSLDPKGGPYLRSSPAELRTWMKLDGSLAWLQPLDKKLRKIMAEYSAGDNSKPLADHDEAQRLSDQAEDKGLVLPSGFMSFMRSTEYHYRMASTSAWFFVLEKLIPCPPTVDDGEGGYLMMFHSDQQGCGFAYLYLSPKDGHHCVLFSLTDLYEEEDVIETVVKEDFALAALTFEEYLVERYYTEILLFRGHGAKGTPSEGFKNFVGAVYRSPREIAQLREHNEAIAVYLDAIKWEGKDKRIYNHISDESSSGEDNETDCSGSEDASSPD
ncbi:hypothetical protein CC79DRAFT_1335462 [Sarocladium strictum]